MGSLTAANIIDQGLQLAGDTQLTTEALRWLNAWLRGQYSSWPWPFLKNAVDIPLPAGTEFVTVGAGTGDVAVPIRRLEDPMVAYKADKSARQQVKIKEWSVQVNHDTSFIDGSSNSNRGLPYEAAVWRFDNVYGKWGISTFPVPDVDYLLRVTYMGLPADIASNATPQYPNDETMVQLIVAMAQKHMNEYDKYRIEMGRLTQMALNDRSLFGMPQGDWQIQLDPNVFR